MGGSGDVEMGRLLEMAGCDGATVTTLALAFNVAAFATYDGSKGAPRIVSMGSMRNDCTNGTGVAFVRSDASPAPVPRVRIRAALGRSAVCFKGFPASILVAGVIKRRGTPRVVRLTNSVDCGMNCGPTFGRNCARVLRALSPGPLGFAVRVPSGRRNRPSIVRVRTAVSTASGKMFACRSGALGFGLVIRDTGLGKGPYRNVSVRSVMFRVGGG